VPEKIERVYRFHHHTLGALRELTQAAGLMHPNEFKATHLVQRTPQHDVRLLANVLPNVRPGQLLEAAAGRCEWPHNVFALYWSRANAASFAPTPPLGASGAIDVERVMHESAA
jgi:hypothetical protein